MIALHPSLRRLRPSRHNWNDILKIPLRLTRQNSFPLPQSTNLVACLPKPNHCLERKILLSTCM